MSPRRKEIKRKRLVQKHLTRYLNLAHYINAEDVVFPSNGMIGHFEGVNFIKMGDL